MLNSAGQQTHLMLAFRRSLCDPSTKNGLHHGPLEGMIGVGN